MLEKQRQSGRKPGRVPVAIADPTDLFAFDVIINHLKREIELAAAHAGPLPLFVDPGYRRTEEISERARNLKDEPSEVVIDFDGRSRSRSRAAIGYLFRGGNVSHLDRLLAEIGDLQQREVALGLFLAVWDLGPTLMKR